MKRALKKVPIPKNKGMRPLPVKPIFDEKALTRSSLKVQKSPKGKETKTSNENLNSHSSLLSVGDWKGLINDHLQGNITLRRLNVMLKLLWGEEVFTDTRRCHENMKTRCRKGMTTLDPEFESLARFALHLGPRPSREFTVDRVDYLEGYSPSNCRWADKKTQTRNRRNSITIECEGEELPVIEWASLLGIPSARFYKKKMAGCSDRELIHSLIGETYSLEIGWPAVEGFVMQCVISACRRLPVPRQLQLLRHLRKAMNELLSEIDSISCPYEFASAEELRQERILTSSYERVQKLFRRALLLTNGQHWAATEGI